MCYLLTNLSYPKQKIFNANNEEIEMLNVVSVPYPIPSENLPTSKAVPFIYVKDEYDESTKL